MASDWHIYAIEDDTLSDDAVKCIYRTWRSTAEERQRVYGNPFLDLGAAEAGDTDDDSPFWQLGLYFPLPIVTPALITAVSQDMQRRSDSRAPALVAFLQQHLDQRLLMVSV